ncbi:MAG: hypothetical protein II982_03550 [Clostridia bacterium]|nr:hypothetical protein [Clostridia bacterium]
MVDSDSSSLTKDVIDYGSVFGKATALRYTPSLNGFKEDIIIDSFSGLNEFCFTLKTNGLRLIELDGLYYLADPDTLDIKVTMGALAVYSNGGTELSVGYDHRYTITTVTENDEYLLEITVDEEFLTDSNTKYPVVVDPSFEIPSSNNNIMDISVRANGIVYNDSVNNGVGHHNVLLENMRAFIKFPGLVNNPLIGTLAPPGYGYDNYNELQSVKLQMYSHGLSYANTQIRVYSYDASSSLNWSYDTTNFTSTQFNALGTYQGYTTVPGFTPQWVDFDITYAVTNGGGSNGIVLVNQYEGTGQQSAYQAFASTKATENKPRIVVTWKGNNNISFDTVIDISNNTLYDVNISESQMKQYFSFTPSVTGFYTITSSDRGSCDPYVWMYNSSQVFLRNNDDGAPGDRNFKIVYHLISGKEYYIAAGCYSTGTGSYKLNISNCTDLVQHLSPHHLIQR